MTTTETSQSLVYSVDEVAKLLRVSRASAYMAVQKGEIPHVKIGRRLLVPRAAFARMLEQKIAAASA